jgi:hypothetical protein
MNRYLPLLCSALLACTAHAQYAQTNGPAPPPAETQAQQSPHPELDGRCKAVRPGDLVHFTLNIRSVEYARAVYADLQMHLGRTYVNDPSGLPPPDFQSLGGGGIATRDAHEGDLYHFTFTIPHDVYSGIYHGSGVYVTAAENDALSNTTGSRSVAVSNRTLHKVRDYCLIVVSPYNGNGQPFVTDFHGGPIERKASTSSTAEPSSSRIYLPTR